MSKERTEVVYTANGLKRAKIDMKSKNCKVLGDLKQLDAAARVDLTPSKNSHNLMLRASNDFMAKTFMQQTSEYPAESQPTYRSKSMLHQFKESEVSKTSKASGPRTGYKFNFSGRSIKGCGTHGMSNSPASHSGWDPYMPRGKSSQLAFDIVADEEKLGNIRNNFVKLMNIRLNQYKPTEVKKLAHFKRANRMNF